MPDLTQDVRVYKVCGKEPCECGDRFSNDGGYHCQKCGRPEVTLEELWEGLNDLTDRIGWVAKLEGRVEVQLKSTKSFNEKCFSVDTNGSLRNAVAAAILWLIERKEE